MWFVEQVTVGYINVLQSTYEHTQPLYIGKNCQNDADMASLFAALSQDCTARRPVRSCKHFR